MSHYKGSKLILIDSTTGIKLSDYMKSGHVNTNHTHYAATGGVTKGKRIWNPRLAQLKKVA